MEVGVEDAETVAVAC